LYRVWRASGRGADLAVWAMPCGRQRGLGASRSTGRRGTAL